MDTASLHVPTLLAMLLMVQVLSALVLGLLWWRNHAIPGLGKWAMGRLLVLAAILVLATNVRAVSPPPLALMLGHGLMVLGMHVGWLGSLAFMGRPTPRNHRPFLLIFLAFEGALAILLAFDQPFSIRATLLSLMMAIYGLLLARAHWPMWRDPDYLLGKLLIASFLVTGLLHLARTLYLPIVAPPGPLLNDNVHGQGMFLAGILSSLLTGFGCVGVTSERLNARLREQAERDPLTGLRNRRSFFAMAEPLLARARRQNLPLAALAIDLDHFKGVNDTHGHAVGDQALVHVSTLLAENPIEGSVLARMGGEEFALLLPGLDEVGALALAEAIRLRVRNTPLPLRAAPGAPLTLTASIGLACAGDAVDIDPLLHRADIALYAAKAAGRDRVVAWSPDGANDAPPRPAGGLARRADRE
jgi:diguanylate cyclase (GGDEF)-like protein